MQELIILFLYHDQSPVTLRHFALVQRHHPADQVIPLGYRLRLPDPLPGTIDVASDQDYGWPIRSVWHEIDKIFLRWYLRPGRPEARRYVFFEYDIEANVHAKDFYKSTWYSDCAAASLMDPSANPEWPWWKQTHLLGHARTHACGVVPLAATMWSDSTLGRIARSRMLQKCYCELRMASLARMFGFKSCVVPDASKRIVWDTKLLAESSTTTWRHPVKS